MYWMFLFYFIFLIYFIFSYLTERNNMFIQDLCMNYNLRDTTSEKIVFIFAWCSETFFSSTLDENMCRKNVRSLFP